VSPPSPNQEQINKLKAESQKTKPQLANHDHQVLIQTEPDDNVKDSTLKLALKHPAQTTIRTITSESWGVFDSHSTDLPPAIFTRTSTLTLYLLDNASTSS
jgi:hypothetical protein